MNPVLICLAAATLSFGFVGCSTRVRELVVAEYDAAADGGNACGRILRALEYVPAAGADMTDIIQDVKVVEMKTSLALGDIRNKLLLGAEGELFVKTESNVFCFSADGLLLRSFGRMGHGEDEYVALQDIALDRESGMLLVLDGMNRVLFFDAATGAFVRTVTLDWRGEALRSDAIFPNEKSGGFYIFSAKLMKREIELSRYCIHEFDSDGVKVAQGLACNDFVLDTAPVAQSFDNRYIVNPVGNEHTVWASERGTIEAAYGIDFGSRGLPSKTRYCEGGELDIYALIMSDAYKMVMNVRETRDIVSFLVCGPEARSYEYVYSKADGSGICLTAPDGYAFPVRFVAADETYLYTIYDRRTMEGLDERACPVSRYLAERFGVIPEGGNPLLVGIRFDLSAVQ